MTKTEEFIISEKDKLKDYIKNEVDNYNNFDINIWGQLMDDILPKIYEFETKFVYTYSSEFKDNPDLQKVHFRNMIKHSRDVRDYYDELISNFLETAQ